MIKRHDITMPEHNTSAFHPISRLSAVYQTAGKIRFSIRN